LQVLAERCVILQDQINHCLNGKYLFWERLTKLIWSKDGIPLHKMPDHMTGIFSFLLASVFGFFLPLYVLWNVLATSQSYIFNSFAAFYIWCLFTAAILAVVTFVSMTRVRDECYHLFKRAIDSGQIFNEEAMYGARPSIAWSNAKALGIISSTAAATTALWFGAVKCLG
jgi:hypothetical protein